MTDLVTYPSDESLRTGSKPKRTPSGRVSNSQPTACEVCKRTVYAAERVTVDGVAFHKTCIRCNKCHRNISVTNAVVRPGEGVFCTLHAPTARAELAKGRPGSAGSVPGHPRSRSVNPEDNSSFSKESPSKVAPNRHSRSVSAGKQHQLGKDPHTSLNLPPPLVEEEKSRTGVEQAVKSLGRKNATSNSQILLSNKNRTRPRHNSQVDESDRPQQRIDAQTYAEPSIPLRHSSSLRHRRTGSTPQKEAEPPLPEKIYHKEAPTNPTFESSSSLVQPTVEGSNGTLHSSQNITMEERNATTGKVTEAKNALQQRAIHTRSTGKGDRQPSSAPPVSTSKNTNETPFHSPTFIDAFSPAITASPPSSSDTSPVRERNRAPAGPDQTNKVRSGIDRQSSTTSSHHSVTSGGVFLDNENKLESRASPSSLGPTGTNIRRSERTKTDPYEKGLTKKQPSFAENSPSLRGSAPDLHKSSSRTADRSETSTTITGSHTDVTAADSFDGELSAKIPSFDHADFRDSLFDSFPRNGKHEDSSTFEAGSQSSIYSNSDSDLTKSKNAPLYSLREALATLPHAARQKESKSAPDLLSGNLPPYPQQPVPSSTSPRNPPNKSDANSSGTTSFLAALKGKRFGTSLAKVNNRSSEHIATMATGTSTAGVSPQREKSVSTPVVSHVLEDPLEGTNRQIMDSVSSLRTISRSMENNKSLATNGLKKIVDDVISALKTLKSIWEKPTGNKQIPRNPETANLGDEVILAQLGQALFELKRENNNGGTRSRESVVQFGPPLGCDALKTLLSNIVPAVTALAILRLPPECTSHGLILPVRGFRIELPVREHQVTPELSAKLSLEHLDGSFKWYRKYFLGKDHRNYFANHDVHGPICVSVVREYNATPSYLYSHSPGINTNYRLIIRRQETPDIRCVIADAELPVKFRGGATTKGAWRAALAQAGGQKLAPYGGASKLMKVVDPGIDAEIVTFDEHQTTTKFKFGILYCADGQITEEEWFGNEKGSPDFDRFLSAVGKRIPLLGWSGFAAGLDTKSGNTGAETIVNDSNWCGYEVTYHVSTLLPHTPGDPQQIQRKRHIGNDIVCIVFLEGNQPFDPSAIRSQFLHVYIVVKKELEKNGTPTYRVGIVSNLTVPEHGPPLPNPPVFENDGDLKAFLLAKMINAEFASYKAPRFSQPHTRARNSLLAALVHRALGTPSSSSSSSRRGSRASSVKGHSLESEPTQQQTRTRRSTFESDRKRLSKPESRNSLVGSKGDGDTASARKYRSDFDLIASIAGDDDSKGSTDLNAFPPVKQEERGLKARLFQSLQSLAGRRVGHGTDSPPQPQPRSSLVGISDVSVSDVTSINSSSTEQISDETRESAKI